MSYYEINAHTNAWHYEQNEKLALTMNVMAIAFGGSAKDRKKMADVLLGITAADFDPDEFESIFANLATPAATTEDNSEIKAWAASEFNPDDPAFKVKK